MLKLLPQVCKRQKDALFHGASGSVSLSNRPKGNAAAKVVVRLAIVDIMGIVLSAINSIAGVIFSIFRSLLKLIFFRRRRSDVSVSRTHRRREGAAAEGDAARFQKHNATDTVADRSRQCRPGKPENAQFLRRS